MNPVGVGLAAVGLGLTAATRIGATAWRRLVNGLVTEVRADARGYPTPLGRFFTEQIAQLPEPVRRYFAFALSPGQLLVHAAHTTSKGEFRMRPEGGWHPFTATQHFNASPRSFVWDAEIAMTSLIPVSVADSHLHGEGGLDPRADGLISVAHRHGTPELAAAELLRYLAVAVMMPTALLPSSGVQWSPVDDNAARATLTDGGTTVSAVFHFGARGEVVRVAAQCYRAVGSSAVLTPWVGQFHHYQSVQGMMVPTVREVAWVRGGGVMSYFRSQTTNVIFELAA